MEHSNTRKYRRILYTLNETQTREASLRNADGLVKITMIQKAVQLLSIYVGVVTNSTKKQNIKVQQKDYKSSAVAKMGDRLATIDMGRKVGGCASFRGSSWVRSPQN